MTDWDKKIFNILKKVPKGKVITYKKLAKDIGHPLAYRAVGNILHNNQNPIVVPCHRVIKSDGSLGGYMYGKKRKMSLLKKEGVIFISENKILADCIL